MSLWGWTPQDDPKRGLARAKSPYTRADEDPLLKALINSTLEAVSQKETIGYASGRGIVRRRLSTAVAWSRDHGLNVIGMDEIALKKGYRDLVVIGRAHVDDGQGVVLGMLPHRQAQTLEAFVQSIPDALRATMGSGCIDRYAMSRHVVKPGRPQAPIGVDRCPVARTYRHAAESHVFDEIPTFFIHRLTSGFVEGLNTKRKVLNRRGFGMFNLGQLFQRVYLDLEGYQVLARCYPYAGDLPQNQTENRGSRSGLQLTRHNP
jgi:transposase